MSINVHKKGKTEKEEEERPKLHKLTEKANLKLHNVGVPKRLTIAPFYAKSTTP